ncbi:MAG: lysophospholipid acyltransferase family protein [Bdellovibrionales bacterium]|nr:lysophospholipid acyltransferase family protein [Bdellovibrionales bacterium]
MFGAIMQTSAKYRSSAGRFGLGFSRRFQAPWLQRILAGLEAPIERACSLHAIGQAYDEIVASDTRDIPFSQKVLEKMRVTYEVAEPGIERIPSSGPAIIVSNHPFGGIEGVILGDLLRKRRPDTKIMANFLLRRVHELEDLFIFVDPFGATGSQAKNLQPLRESIEWVTAGGVLVIFPSGTVSHFQWRTRDVSDPAWSPTIARIIRKTGAPVIPMFFHGRNGLAFQAAGAIHPLLRTAMLPTEFWNKCGKHFSLKVGTAISTEKVLSVSDDDELMSYLRLRSYLLGSGDPGALRERQATFRRRKRSLRRAQESIIAPIDPHVLAAELAALPPEQILGENGDYLVAHGTAREIPQILREIGRLREVTFRLVQEGTGKSIDLDHFDSYYTHLFVWNRSTYEVVGAYRLVKTDHVLRTHGKNGLYTSTLFAYRPELLRQIGPALELGRSFIRSEYQRNFNSLNLLWKGIGTYVAKNPDYPILFGTVSISSEYDSVSRQLIAAFLRANRYLPELARQIRARNPLPKARLRGVDVETSSVVVKDVQEVSDLIAEIEASERRMPVLLRQYLKLGGRLLGFNIDPDFGNVLDGLIYVDLRDTDERLLERYMGKEHIRSFYAHHGKTFRPLRAVTERTD